jgi:long-chain acyl-CoA synthetase
LLEGERADVVPIVERHRAEFLQVQHAAYVRGNRIERTTPVFVRIALAQFGRRGKVETLRHVAAQRIVRRGLVGEQIGHHAALGERRDQVRAVSYQSHRDWLALSHSVFQDAQRFVEVVDHHVAVAGLDAALDAFRVHVDPEKRTAVERRRERLRAAHPAQPARDNQFSGQVAAEMFLCCRRECFVRALQDSLRSDVDPASGRHLAVHRQSGAVELAEFLPVIPVADQIRVGDQHARRIFMRAEDSDWFAGLHQKRLVIFEAAQRRDNRVIASPVSRRLAAAAVNDQVRRALGHFGVEVVHEHAQRSFLLPALAGERASARRANDSAACGSIESGIGHRGHLIARGSLIALAEIRAVLFSFYTMAYPTLTEKLLGAIDRVPNDRAVVLRVSGRWEPMSSAEFLRRIAGLSGALEQLGVKPGDRVGLFAPNRPEWHIADFAILGLGAADVPIYFNESPDRIVYILNHSGAEIVFVAGEMQSRRVLECRSRLTSVKHIICAAAPPDLGDDVLRYETLAKATGDEAIAEYRLRAARVTSDQVATIIYTSGTSGEPKGVVLTHNNFSSNEEVSAEAFGMSPADTAVSFLPLSHVYERVIAYAYLFRGVQVAYVERMEDLLQALVEVHPSLAAAVPRVFEKTYANILQKGQENTGVKRRLFDWAMGVALRSVRWRAYGEHAPLGLRISWGIADRVVYSRIRDGVGGRVRAFISGGGPLSRELAEFFWAVGVPVYQGYGLTETSPVVSANCPSANKVGSVGKPIAHVDVRIAEDGEIFVHGPCVMQGYYQKPDETRAVISPDGWLATGDIGRLDSDGYLYVTDRKKDLFKTAAGKFVAPQPIENLLKSSPLVLNAVLVGDKRRFIAALIVPNFANVEAGARLQGRTFASHEQLAADPWVHDLIGREVERINSTLAQYETIKRFALLDHDFTFDNGQLTYTLKLKRRVIDEHYAKVIESLFAGA